MSQFQYREVKVTAYACLTNYRATHNPRLLELAHEYIQRLLAAARGAA
jgi:hypothetical protein